MEELKEILMEQLRILQNESRKTTRSNAMSQLAALSREMSEIGHVLYVINEHEYYRAKREEGSEP